MAKKENCKGCSASVWMPSEDIKKLVDEILNSNEFDLVSEAVYKSRLDQCHNCKHLDYATTCMQCGCIVQVRALLRDKDCPNPGKSKWQI